MYKVKQMNEYKYKGDGEYALVPDLTRARDKTRPLDGSVPAND